MMTLLNQNNSESLQDFTRRLRETQAAREAQIQRTARTATMDFLEREVGKGFSIQESGDFLLKCLKSNRHPAAYICAVREILETCGWVGRGVKK